MLIIDRSVITDGGAALLNSGDPINITSVKTGSGTYTSSEDIKSRTALKSTQYSYTPSSVTVDGATRSIDALLSNYDPVTEQAIVTSDYTLTEVGLFATVNGADVLFAIGVSYDGSEVPAFTGQNKSEIIVNWDMAVSGTDAITITATGAPALATDLNAHVGTLVLTNSGVHGIRAVKNGDDITLQVNDGGTWKDVAGGGTTIVQKPTVTVGTYTYNGSAQGPTITWDAGMADNCVVTNATKTNAGTYTLIIALKNSAKMVWNDMTTADLVYTYTISKATLTVPTVTDTTKTYNGSVQSPTITGFDSTTMTKTGDSATDAGNYTITFGLIDSTNYEWDTTNTVNWSIAKADQTITLSSNSVTLDSEHLTATVTVSGAQGAISVTSSASSVATASVSGSTITISSVNNTGGNATITVVAEATTNYNSASGTISITASFGVTYTLRLNMNDSNPNTWGTYVDCSVTELSAGGGENEIDEFMGYYPVVLTNGTGAEYKKINPANKAKYIDGTDVSTSDGDCMIAFPNRGYKISWYDANTLEVSITSKKNQTGYTYITYKGNLVDKYYLSMYCGHVDTSSKLRSWGGVSPVLKKSLHNGRINAEANGSGYELMSYLPLVYLQCCGLLKYKGRNMQTALGMGNVDNSSILNTGGTFAKGMNFGETTGKLQMCLFGVEDLWGNISNRVDGVVTSSNYHVLVSDGNFNDSGTGYTDAGATGFTSSTGSNAHWPSRVAAESNEMGFFPKGGYLNGSASTFLCDTFEVWSNTICEFGGSNLGTWGGASGAGLFSMMFYNDATREDVDGYACRLAYFKTVS